MGGKFKFSLKKIKIHTWQLFLILIPLLFLTATFLRLDHVKMTELRSAVLDADASGDEDKLTGSLSELAEFTRKNIIVNITEENGLQKLTFGTGPFYLEQTYRRDAEKAIAEAEAKSSDDTNPYGNIFASAMNICKPQAISAGWAWNSEPYLNCMTSEINKYPASEDLTSQLIADIPSTELYRKEFSSPIWTFSISGLLILLCLILIAVIFIRLFIWLIIRLSLLFL